MLNDYEAFRVRIDDQRGSLPIAQKEITLLKDKVREAEREVSVKTVELKVLTNKYNILREDYSTLRLAQMAKGKLDQDSFRQNKSSNRPQPLDEDVTIELVREN